MVFMSQNMKLIGVKMSPETHDAILQAASLAVYLSPSSVGSVWNGRSKLTPHP